MFQLILKNTKHTALVLGILGFSFVACQSNQAENTKISKKGVTTAVRTDTVSYKKQEIKKISQYFSENNGEIDTTYIQVSYPDFADSSMNSLINQTILLDGEQSIDQYTDNFIEGYGNFIEENEVNYNLPWSKITDVEVLMYTPQLITLKNMTYEYSGGAHGNTFELLNVYDLENYQKLALNTFISENKMKEFTKIAEKFFRKEEGLSDTASLEKSYFFENGKFALAANYGINKEGVFFHYNQYEIKPYAAGTTTVIIPFDAVQDVMTETGKNYIKQVKEYYHSTH
ncbi:DUF4163 domain-containing protein [Sphingobacterium sp. DK4209]|uniref:DUF4163 domain-containing protein n=1 Tax=Sphingobacterium zhuxiongii TaxID=2662364 RepID=A0A5Q0Q7K5_9SPHI|nr:MULTISPECIES: DUF3298 and DUF4163 domain-containing protein [unclassified Sphingobacterium]MVZ65097.1 DUF4163 domain-containing protein [Sphingobacterium sp. DK4209]QGA26045.1 DUF4163 domain-containing protein [Sphingobacterium sp. dk4302]